jgi:hypothetical protein
VKFLFLSALILILNASLAYPCDCVALPAKKAKAVSELVFWGTITGFRDSGEGYDLAIFEVALVWKGDVRRTFTMPALQGDNCHMFPGVPGQLRTGCSLLKIGNELLVYASRIRGSGNRNYYPMPCNTVKFAIAGDVHSLGRGKKPIGL